MARAKSPPFIRFMVSDPNWPVDAWPPWVRQTPRYFNEREKSKAVAYAAEIGSFVVDLFREYERRFA